MTNSNNDETEQKLIKTLSELYKAQLTWQFKFHPYKDEIVEVFTRQTTDSLTVFEVNIVFAEAETTGWAKLYNKPTLPKNKSLWHHIRGRFGYADEQKTPTEESSETRSDQADD